jgi:putative nucleotide binding protein
MGPRQQQPKKFEEYAYVLDIEVRGRAKTVRGKEGVIVQSLGEDYLTFLELLGVEGVLYTIGEKLYIGKERRDKVVSVLGRLSYSDLTPTARSVLPDIVEKIVESRERKFIDFFNGSQPLNPRMHALELIPGIGKAMLRKILDERDRSPFTSYKDIEQRVGLKDVRKQLAKRIMEELEGGTQTYLFVKRP